MIPKMPFAYDYLVIEEAVQRDEELSSGKVTGRSDEEVMRAARRVLQSITPEVEENGSSADS